MTSERLRLAFVVHSFGVGGVERCIARLVEHLDPARFEPRVLCLSRSGAAANWIRRRVSIAELHKRHTLDLGAVRRMARLLRGVHVVHSHNWGTLVETALARRWAGVPVHVHAERGQELDAIRASGWRRRRRELASTWVLRRCEAVVTNAHAIRRRLERRCGRLRRPIAVIPNGVDAPPESASPSQRAALRRSLGIGESAFVLGSVGRLAPVKNFGVAIAALARLQRDGADAHLLIVGEGAERERLRAAASAQGVAARVHLVGSHNNVHDWIASMDVYLNTSLNEGMSQSLLEALSVGLPCVATDVGDSARVLNGAAPCGLVVPMASPGDVAEAVARLLARPDWRAELSANARARYAERHRVETMVDAYDALYCELLGRRP